ncbi:MAG TPA: hypothetical protein VLT33_23245, partial [Labilithrix sp.]|nr:hypothetical protein [Labilithrix sp.]
MRYWGGIAMALAAAACNGAEGAVVESPVSAKAKTDPKPEATALESDAGADPGGWVTATRTPWAPVFEAGRDPRELALAAVCGGEDAALTRVAREIAGARARGLGAPDADGIVQRLRVAGDPHVRPRLVVASG